MWIHAVLCVVSAGQWNIHAAVSLQERAGKVQEQQATSRVESAFLTLSRVAPSVHVGFQGQEHGWNVSYEPQLTLRWPQGTHQVRSLHQGNAGWVWQHKRRVWKTSLQSTWTEGLLDRIDVMGRSEVLNNVSSQVLRSPVQHYRYGHAMFQAQRMMNRRWNLGVHASGTHTALWDPLQETASTRMLQQRYQGGVQLQWSKTSAHQWVWEVDVGRVAFVGTSVYHNVDMKMRWSHAQGVRKVYVEAGAVYASPETFLGVSKARVLPVLGAGYESWWLRKGERGLKWSGGIRVDPLYDMFSARVEPRVDIQGTLVWVMHPRWSWSNTCVLRHVLWGKQWLKTQGQGDDAWALASTGVQYHVGAQWYVQAGVQGLLRVREHRSDHTHRQQQQYYGYVSMTGRMGFLE
jgi:hypothetical protein